MHYGSLLYLMDYNVILLITILSFSNALECPLFHKIDYMEFRSIFKCIVPIFRIKDKRKVDYFVGECSIRNFNHETIFDVTFKRVSCKILVIRNQEKIANSFQGEVFFCVCLHTFCF